MASNGQADHKKGIDEDEAALYDRQIRLWGVEAQNRMKTAAVLVVNLRGLAAEVCKNIVLAGIGSLTIADDKDVVAEDLGSNYFLRDEDIGHKRVTAAQSRIQALNPRVKVETLTDLAILKDEDALAKFDLICLTDSDPQTISRVNAICRKTAKTKLYAGASLGVNGYIFADLLHHEYTVQRADPSAKVEAGMDVPKIPVKKAQSFVTFDDAMQHTWENQKPALKKKQISRMAGLFEVLAILDFQQRNDGKLPESDSSSKDLSDTLERILPAKGITSLPGLVDQDRITLLASTATTDFSASCAVVGGILAQDILNCLGGREAPLMNFLVFDGNLCAADIYPLGITRTTA